MQERKSDDASGECSVEESPFGRVVVPRSIPAGFAVVYTTIDFDGALGEGGARRITDYVRSRFGIDAVLATCVQVHGRSVHRVRAARSWNECDSCDALWTDETNVALGIKVADCLPVTMIDPVHKVIANAHSGWRGTALRITDATVEAAAADSAFAPGEAIAYLGPTIRACCFEVGEEVVEQLAEAYGEIEAFVDRGKARSHVDLPGLTRQRLEALGFAADRIVDLQLCTRCEGSMFHSYRRQRRTGRNLAVVAQ